MAAGMCAFLLMAAPHVDGVGLLTPATTAGDATVTDALARAAPVLVSALVFQNVVPNLAKRFEGDSAKIRESIVLGSAQGSKRVRNSQL